MSVSRPIRASAARGLLVAMFVGLGAATARAQIPDQPYTTAGGRLSFGADLTVATSPRDHDAFFNFTDYGQNDLRMGRFRLLGEWRLRQSLSFLGELRAENGDGLEAAAWYLRWRPWKTRGFDLQVGRIPPVAGTFARQPYGRDNPLIGTPLAYQYLTSLRSDALPATADDLLRMRGQGWKASYPIGSQTPATGLPLVSAFHWDTGVEAHWQQGWIDLAGAVTRGSPSVPIAGADSTPGVAWSGRAAVRAPAGLTVGLSAERGDWIGASVLQALPVSLRARAEQTVVGADVTFGWGRWLVRGEELHSSFQIPFLDAPTASTTLGVLAAFVEARYRILPRWQVAARIERLDFTSIQGTLYGGSPTPWDAPVERSEIDLGFRVTRNLELRGGWQMNWRDGGQVIERGYPAAELLYWF
jgi:hypothetical protein